MKRHNQKQTSYLLKNERPFKPFSFAEKQLNKIKFKTKQTYLLYVHPVNIIILQKLF